MEAVKSVGIKYCGGCNPEIDRSGVAKEIQAFLPKGFKLVDGAAPTPWDFGILICGCGVACAQDPELMSLARQWILVSGTVVDDVEVAGGRIAEVIVQRLSKIACK